MVLRDPRCWVKQNMCQFKVWNPPTRRYRNCKIKSARWISVCHVHARQFVSKIQAAWRMYRTRNLVNRFKHIGDPWSIVLKHLEFHNKKHKLYESHRKIYQNRAEYWGNMTIMLHNNLIALQRERNSMPVNVSQEVQDLVKQEEVRLSLRKRISEHKRCEAMNGIFWTTGLIRKC